MRIRLLSITHKTPKWIEEGFQDYAKRLPPTWVLETIPIAAEKRGHHADIKRITEREGEKMLAHIKPNHRVIALDVEGKSLSSEALAKQFAEWDRDARPIDFLIGGPEGLAPNCLKRAEMHLSLSKLTFPHLMVKLIVAEQIYRVYTLLQGLPYHR